MNSQKHVIVLYFREGESYWLYTRDMAEFGGPDIGISGVPEEKVDAYNLREYELSEFHDLKDIQSSLGYYFEYPT